MRSCCYTFHEVVRDMGPAIISASTLHNHIKVTNHYAAPELDPEDVHDTSTSLFSMLGQVLLISA
jgi:hypothetical protein